jgi:hypothetical protein
VAVTSTCCTSILMLPLRERHEGKSSRKCHSST